jgi:hypothetical protein
MGVARALVYVDTQPVHAIDAAFFGGLGVEFQVRIGLQAFVLTGATILGTGAATLVGATLPVAAEAARWRRDTVASGLNDADIVSVVVPEDLLIAHPLLV